MQRELAEAYPELPIRLVVVNQSGHDVGLPLVFDVTDLPVVQDEPDVGVWSSWRGGWRDLWILDRGNVPYEVVNLTSHDLAVAENYEAVYALLVEAATAPP